MLVYLVNDQPMSFVDKNIKREEKKGYNSNVKGRNSKYKGEMVKIKAKKDEQKRLDIDVSEKGEIYVNNGEDGGFVDFFAHIFFAQKIPGT